MASSGRVQNLELVSILLQCVKPWIWAIMSTNLCIVSVSHITASKVRGSKHTCNLPLSFTTSTKASTQSEASFMSSFLMTFMVSILSNSSFNESLSSLVPSWVNILWELHLASHLNVQLHSL